MSEFFVAFYVGCIECGVPSSTIGVYETKEQADAAADEILAGGDSWKRHGGDGYIHVSGPHPVGAVSQPGKD